MPKLCEFYGISIYMYFFDHNPPHIHAFYSGSEARFRIIDGAHIDGRMPVTAVRLIQEWISIQRSQLMSNWNAANTGEPIVKLEPLR